MKRFIFVAGVDYSSPGRRGYFDFPKYCTNRIESVRTNGLYASPKDDLEFQVFNFKSGDKTTYIYRNGSRVGEPKPEKIAEPITQQDYCPPGLGSRYWRFKDGQRDKMSIEDIYAEVQKIGREDPAHTLVELSFFSHSHHNGPVFVNSFPDLFETILKPGEKPVCPGETGGARKKSIDQVRRDPDDMDARAGKDFEEPTNMPTNLLDDFKNAFHSTGHLWNWGCNNPPLMNDFLDKVVKNRKYRPTGVSDEEVFEFKDLHSIQIQDLKNMLLNPFMAARYGAVVDIGNDGTVKIKFKFLKYFICVLNQRNYNAYFARKVGVPAYGGFVGTSSDKDPGRPQLMWIIPSFQRIVRFFNKYLDYKLDLERRNYGRYLPEHSCIPPPIP